eukprot:m.7712 g.7712  ORF g.7712 m.7712 type:complete len:63 (+) comp5860_c0_seq3:2462-2650(+)
MIPSTDINAFTQTLETARHLTNPLAPHIHTLLHFYLISICVSLYNHSHTLSLQPVSLKNLLC